MASELRPRAGGRALRCIGSDALAVHARREHARLRSAFVALEQRVLLQESLELLVELQRRKLQQSDRLLQLRSEGEVLGEPELEGVLHAF